ncbi:two component transcriptional regulator, LuxR family [Streptomyces sp. yr375]|uniref:response regulator transcription factor n=1 Tax=Streptomyces sp. yr375 TaxID=1761906 RepID=UPI0008CEC70F|nr:response regulator transcription factor [Streptomyces sp. yr375]SES27410.1 two component transcriptional regulator, LuxR family [Streptomyces sp. yr375]
MSPRKERKERAEREEGDAGRAAGGAGITVVLVDDHALVREGLREIIDSQDDMTVVGEADHSEAAVARVTRHRPDIVLLDIEIPGGEPTDTVTRMRALSPTSQIIIVSMYDGPQLLRRLIAAGIRGYLLKSVDHRELISAIRSVRHNPDRMVLAVSRGSLAQLQGSDDVLLSPRELEILRLVAQALTNNQISHRLLLSEATVKRNLRNIFAKLDANSRIDAVNKGIAASLISPQRDR